MQLVDTAPVVYTLPLQAPAGQVPVGAAAAKPELAMTVNEEVPPTGMVCTVEGVTEPLAPTEGVTVRTFVLVKEKLTLQLWLTAFVVQVLPTSMPPTCAPPTPQLSVTGCSA